MIMVIDQEARPIKYSYSWLYKNCYIPLVYDSYLLITCFIISEVKIGKLKSVTNSRFVRLHIYIPI